MTDDVKTNIRASRMHVARRRGALSGALLVILGLWALLVPFIGRYLDVKTTPSPDSAWKWTAARGWLEVLPGAVAAVGGLVLLLSSHRLVLLVGGWIAAAAGAWLVVGPALASTVHLTAPVADPAAGQTTRAVTALLTFYAIGAAIVLFAGLALGRLSVHGIADVRAAERRAQRAAEREEAERRAAEQRLAAERDRRARENDTAEHTLPGHAGAEQPGTTERPATAPAAGQHAAGDEFADYRTSDQPAHPAHAAQQAPGAPAHAAAPGQPGQAAPQGQYPPAPPAGDARR